MLAPGTRIDRYVIEGPAPFGLLGSVYLALDPLLTRRVNLELIPNDKDIDLRRDWPSATALTHPATVRLYDFGIAGSDVFIVSEQVTGRTLREVLNAQSLPSIAERLRWMEDLCAGIGEAHRLGLRHGGLTPDILIVTDDNRLRITGFGMSALYAKLLQPGYDAPEVMAGASIDERSDVFSLGAICFEVLTGRRAYPGATDAEIAFRALGFDAMPRAGIGLELDPELVATIARALQRDRARRLAGATELAAAITRVRTRPSSDTSAAWPTTTLPPPGLLPPTASVQQDLPRDEPARDSSRPLEQVQFTVYRPRSVQESSWARMLVFMHLADRRRGTPPEAPSPAEHVRALALAALGSEVPRFSAITADARHGVPLEGEITLIPTMELVEFDPERRMFRWVEDVHQESFLFKAHPLHTGNVVRGTMAVYSGALLIAEIDISIRVERVSDFDQPAESSTAVPYRKIFASYAHTDREIVRQFERYVESLGDRYLTDLRDLRSGEKWSPRLLELIDQADVFQLFWSTSAMRSPHVRREWEHALSLGRPAFVRPTYWEDPLPASEEEGLPPEALQRIHFHRLCLPDQIADVARAGRESRHAAKSAYYPPDDADARDAKRRRAEDDFHRRLIESASGQLESGDLDQALLTCREALRLRDTSAEALKLKSRIEALLAEHHRLTDERQRDDERRARALALERQRTRREEAIQAAVHNGRRLLQRGEIDDAERVLHDAELIDWRHAAFQQLRAEIYDARDRQRAEANRRRLEKMEQSRRAEIEQEAARQADREERQREASIASEQARREAAIEAILRKSRVALEQGDLESGRQGALAALQLEPNNAEVARLRAELEAAIAEARRREEEAPHAVEAQLPRAEAAASNPVHTSPTSVEAEKPRSPKAHALKSPSNMPIWLLGAAIATLIVLLRGC